MAHTSTIKKGWSFYSNKAFDIERSLKTALQLIILYYQSDLRSQFTLENGFEQKDLKRGCYCENSSPLQ